MLNFENLDKALYYSDTKYQVPILDRLEPSDDEIEKIKKMEWIPFSSANANKDRQGKGIHFFIDDYRFVRVWNTPDRYVDMLKQYEYVLTPDFSTYRDMPLAMQIYNTYRKQWVGKYYQDKGIKIIPTISWSTPASYEWIFDGIPTHSIVAISTLGCLKDKRATELFYEGWRVAYRTLQPEVVLCYGKIPDRLDGNVIEMGTYNFFNSKENQKE